MSLSCCWSRGLATEAGSSAFSFAIGVRQGVLKDSAGRRNAVDREDGTVLPNKLTWSFRGLTDEEVVAFLLKNVVWDKYDMVALNKPYNVCCQGGRLPPHSINLLQYLPAMAERLSCAHLHPVHRLDRTSTGVLLLAKSETVAKHLRLCFKERRVEKYYYCITRDAPQPPEGVVKIPLVEVTQPDGRHRVALRPRPDDLDEVPLPLRGPGRLRDAWPAETRYRLLQRHERSALLEVRPLTGYRHQIRAHLGHGLETPVLGDHKFSSVAPDMRPQRLPDCTLRRLSLRGPQARRLPLFLHAQRLVVPVDPDSLDRVSTIKAPFPYRFARALRSLRLQLPFKMRVSRYI